MQTLSSARRTCMALASAVECTATVWMPSSLQARRMRRAISPRLAIRTFWNMGLPLLDDDEWLAVFDRLGILEQDTRDGARAMCGDLVHRFHGFDDQQGLAFTHLGADGNKGSLAGFGRTVGGADHGGGQGARVGSQVFRTGRSSCSNRAGWRNRGRRCRWGRRIVLRRSVGQAFIGIRAGDPDPEILLLDLYLHEIFLVQQLGDGLDQVLIHLR